MIYNYISISYYIHMELLEECEMDEPCPVMEVSTEDCPICAHSGGDASCIQKMNDIEETLTGKVSSEEIYRIQYQLFEHEIKEPLQRQGLPVPSITIDIIRTHYEKHRMNTHMVVSKEILVVNEMQRLMQDHQMAVQSGNTKRLLLKEMDQWQKLSKHKLELLKYYNSLAVKKSKANAASIKPYEFN